MSDFQIRSTELLQARISDRKPLSGLLDIAGGLGGNSSEIDRLNLQT